MTKPPPSRILRRASVLFAWICWAIAYWQSLWWLVPVSFIPYFLSNSYGHLLDKDRDEDRGGQ
ncbi:hypothetical protein [Paracidovorax anthurii]|uniref:Uncharacterized protein n=1 Tax=Paracidovorax anthurii TaxID=78229 RepID=A0A328ZRC5_9BURK|nr:hypothetical protein [Paracidovorax anthurii]RAR84836.1 hypothetical protein AX018_100968 [Paracidovorax anthurii]